MTFIATRVRTLHRFRSVLANLVARDIKLKYQSSKLGYLWSLFEPLLLTGVYYVVFSLIARFGIEDYPLFLVTALLPWLWFNSTMNAAVTAISSQGKLLTKVYLPRETPAMAAVGAKAFEYFAALPVLAFFAIISGRPPTLYLLALPLAIIIQLILHVGLSLALSAANTLFRDIERLIRIVLRAMFYASPIIYHTTMAIRRIPSLSWLYWVNPLTGIFELSRAAFFPQYFPGWGYVVSSLIGSLVLLLLGWGLFGRLESLVLKEL